MYDDGTIHIEKDDQCFTCEHFAKGVSCPLLEAMAVGVVQLQQDITVKNCGFYKEFKRHLSVVENRHTDGSGDTPPGTTAAGS
ncbi:MAG: hypothetical protein KTR14_09465 [Vampirovibrio sp.]|nr:hypothetical protein [Vampirovibrio sp.]